MKIQTMVKKLVDDVDTICTTYSECDDGSITGGDSLDEVQTLVNEFSDKFSQTDDTGLIKTIVETTENVVKTHTITVPLSELKKVIPDIPNLDGIYSDPLWEEVKWLWSTTCGEIEKGSGELIYDLLDEPNTRMMVEMDDGSVEPYSVFKHQ